MAAEDRPTTKGPFQRMLETALGWSGLAGPCPICFDEGLQNQFCPVCGRWDIRDEDEIADAYEAQYQEWLKED